MTSGRPLILSIFPGVDLLGMAFEQEWPEACIVRGPDPIFGGDIRAFHPPAGLFAGVIGGPPCQPFSRLRHMVAANGYAPRHENLIPEFERVVRIAAPRWFVMEEVPAAPEPVVEGFVARSVVVNNRWFGAEQNRVRRITFGVSRGLGASWNGCLHDDRTNTLARFDLSREFSVLESAVWEPVVHSHSSPTPVALVKGGARKSTADKPPRTIGEMLRLQGLAVDWLDECPLTESGKRLVIGNGVPLPMGRAIAAAVRRALESAPA